MNWENCVVKINVKLSEIDFNHPLNVFNTITATGTGFFISKKQVLTCYHVVKNAINIDILYKQTNNISGTIKYIFPEDDLAIIEIDKDFDDIKILDFKVINTRQIGDVFTVGFPLSSTNIKITKGIISGYQESLIQTDATLNSGNSGGPLVIQEGVDYKVIGVNVSKMTGDAEKTGFVVPIYRFIINQSMLESNIVVNKPVLYLDYQNIIQDELRQKLFEGVSNGEKYIKEQIGIRISMLNKKYYLNKHLKVNDVILSINCNTIDYNGYIKWDFYPEKIPFDDLGLWFIQNDVLRFEVLDTTTKEIRFENIKLELIGVNLLEVYLLPNYPKYWFENNGLILSVVSKQHIESIKDLNLSLSQIVKILNRKLYQADLFTVYLADLDFSKIKKFFKFPIGEIIIEINDKTFNNYEEFAMLMKEPTRKIKTSENQIYYLA